MSRKLFVRDPSNITWENLFVDQNIEITDIYDHFTSTYLDGALNELYDRTGLYNAWRVLSEQSYSNESVDLSLLDLNGDSSSYIRIEIEGSGDSDIILNFNSDTTSSDYKNIQIYGTEEDNSFHFNTSNSLIPIWKSSEGFSISYFNLKSGKDRYGLIHIGGHDSNSNYYRYDNVGVWLDSTSNITSINLSNSSGSFTGTIKIWSLDAGTGSGTTSAEPSSSLNYNEITSDTTASANDYLFVNSIDSTGISVTLPINPSMGDSIYILDATGSFGINSITVYGNGEKIQGSMEPLILDVDSSETKLIYYNSTYGWRVV